MKTFLSLLLVFIATTVQSQKWKELYIAATGDTLKPGYYIKLIPGRSYGSITPKAEDQYSYQMMAKRKAFLDTDLQGKNIKIDRLSRIRRGKEYTAIAVFEISDYHLDPLNSVEYMVKIDDALKNGEIEIIKP